MDGLVAALVLTLFPTVGTLAGGLLALRLTLSKTALSFVLHLAAGVVLGVVAIELIPRALEADPPWVILVAFAAGGAFYIATDWGADTLTKRFGNPESGGVWGMVVGVGIDLVTDGMMIAAGESVGQGLGLLLGIGLLIADAPEAFSTIATMRDRGVSKRSTLLVALAFPLLVLLGAPIGYFLVAGASQLFSFALLAATAGILVLVVVEGMVPEAHAQTRREAGQASGLFVTGFTVFAFLSLYLGA